MATIQSPSSLQTLFLVARRFLLGAPKFRYVGAGYDGMDTYVLDAIPPSMIPPPPPLRQRRIQPLHFQPIQQEQFQLQPIEGPHVSDNPLSTSTTLPLTTTSTTAMAAAAASTAILSSHTTNISTIPEYSDVPQDDDLDDSLLSRTYTLETIDPNRPPPIPYWYDSPHFRPDV